MYDRTTVRPYKVLLLTCVVNCTAGTPTPRFCPVVRWSVHWAPSQTTRVLVLAAAKCCALETRGEKKFELRFQAWLSLYINSLYQQSYAFQYSAVYFDLECNVQLDAVPLSQVKYVLGQCGAVHQSEVPFRRGHIQVQFSKVKFIPVQFSPVTSAQ